MSTRFTAALLLTSVLSAPTVGAHHSFAAEFYAKNCRDFTGVLTKLDWQNPHAYFYMDVKDAKGETTTWTLEATSVRGILANGVKREDVKAGDKIKVRCHLLRDGSTGCLLGFVTPDHGDQARGHGVEKEWD